MNLETISSSIRLGKIDDWVWWVRVSCSIWQPYFQMWAAVVEEVAASDKQDPEGSGTTKVNNDMQPADISSQCGIETLQ